MTTATPGYTPTRRGASVLVPLAGSLLVGTAAVVLGALVAGSPAAAGAANGTVMVCAFFAFGAVVLGVVAKAAPAASMLVALLTYTLNVVLVGLVFVGLARSGALQDAVAPRWLAGAVIACTLVWTTTQIVVATRTRQPIFDLPSDGQEASVR